VGPRRKFLTLPGLEFRHLRRPAHSHDIKPKNSRSVFMYIIHTFLRLLSSGTYRISFHLPRSTVSNKIKMRRNDKMRTLQFHLSTGQKGGFQIEPRSLLQHESNVTNKGDWTFRRAAWPPESLATCSELLLHHKINWN
jgi:hypothetical protein